MLCMAWDIKKMAVDLDIAPMKQKKCLKSLEKKCPLCKGMLEDVMNRANKVGIYKNLSWT